MVSGAGVFSEEEVEIAEELVDGALDPQGDPDPYLILIAELDEQIVGYVCYGHIPMTQASWDLYWIATDPKVRRQGVAHKLCQEMEADIRQRGGKQVRVETSSTSGYESAHRFYERTGYPVVCRLTDFYKPGDDLLQMYKVL